MAVTTSNSRLEAVNPFEGSCRFLRTVKYANAFSEHGIYLNSRPMFGSGIETLFDNDKLPPGGTYQPPEDSPITSISQPKGQLAAAQQTLR